MISGQLSEPTAGQFALKDAKKNSYSGSAHVMLTSDIQLRIHEEYAAGNRPTSVDPGRSGPGPARVVALIYNERTKELLVEQPEELPLGPFDHGKLVATRDDGGGLGTTPNRSVFLGEGDLALEAVPVDLNLGKLAADVRESSDRSSGGYGGVAGVEAAFGQFGLKSNG